MGAPPPPDFPAPPQPPAIPAALAAAAALLQKGFSLQTPSAALCGFVLPSFLFAYGVKIPSPLPIPPPIPIPKLAIGLSCNLSNPLEISAGLEWGGGRTATFDPDPDDGPF